MRKLFLIVIALALMVGGCATLGMGPSKTSTGYTYMSNINPEDISNGKYSLIFGEMIDPFTAVGFYFQPEKNRVFGVIYAYDQGKNELSLFRIWYVEKDELVIIDRNDEKKEWVKRVLSELELTGDQINSIKRHLFERLEDINQEKKI